MTRVYVLLGGLWGWDGPFVSPGMLTLANRIAKLPNVVCDRWNWSQWTQVHQDIGKQSANTKIALIGYSGGGSRATAVAAQGPKRRIDLLIAYDPSPKEHMRLLGANVAKALCYFNKTPNFGGLGGGRLTGAQVETIEIAKNHLIVQFDEALHRRTLAEIGKLL